jgi:uncharacterized protein
MVTKTAWDHNKLEANLAQHGLDFRDAHLLFDGRPQYSALSPRGDETRIVSVGVIEGRFVAVVWMDRHGVRRIISMRRARHGEEGKYRELYP